MREKAAFSDAVGHSLRDDLIELAESTYTDEEFETRRKLYKHAQPFTKESLLYREIFEKYYKGHDMDGNEIEINNGKTFVCVVQNDEVDNVVVE